MWSCHPDHHCCCITPRAGSALQLPLTQARWLHFFRHSSRMGEWHDISKPSIRPRPRTGNATQDVHVTPGWLRTLEADPQPSPILRTMETACGNGYASARNMLVIMSWSRACPGLKRARHDDDDDVPISLHLAAPGRLPVCHRDTGNDGQLWRRKVSNSLPVV